MAKTTTATRQDTAPPPAPRNEITVAPLSAPRLPMIPNIADYGFEKDGKIIPYGEAEWRSLVQSIFPGAKSAASINLALAYCKSRNLDVFKKVCHIVPINQGGSWVETIWPGVAEPRITATRTKGYAGLDMPTFGPTIKRTFKGKKKEFGQSGGWYDFECTVEYPEWCQITVYRIVAGQRYAFPGPRCNWVEFYTRYSPKFELPNDRWERSPTQMLEKCAEVAALRRAFPEELGDEPTIDEAGAHNAGHDAVDVTEQGSASVDPPRRENYTDQNPTGAQPAQAQQAEQQKPTEQKKDPPPAQRQQQEEKPAPKAQPQGDPRPEPPPPEGAKPLAAAQQRTEPQREQPQPVDRRGNPITDIDPATGEIDTGKAPRDAEADAAATRAEQHAAAGQPEEDENDDIPFGEDDPPTTQGAQREYPPEYELPDRPLKFTEFTKVGSLADFSEPFLEKTNPAGARAWKSFYAATIATIEAKGTPAMKKQMAYLDGLLKQALAKPEDPKLV